MFDRPRKTRMEEVRNKLLVRTLTVAILNRSGSRPCGNSPPSLRPVIHACSHMHHDHRATPSSSRSKRQAIGCSTRQEPCSQRGCPNTCRPHPKTPNPKDD